VRTIADSQAFDSSGESDALQNIDEIPSYVGLPAVKTEARRTRISVMVLVPTKLRP
jgi:hypothetical protein